MYSEITKLIEPIKGKSLVQFKIGPKLKKVEKGLKTSMFQNLKGIKGNKISVNNNYNLNNFI